MKYKGYEILGVARIEAYATLDDDGYPSDHVDSYGDWGNISDFTYVQDVDENDLSENGFFLSIDEVKAEIDTFVESDKKFIDSHFIIGGIK